MANDNLPLAGKIALVTGCGRGIGRAVALALARAGAGIVVNDIAAGSLEELAGEIRALGRPALTCVGSVGERAAVDEMFARVAAEFKGLDILVNNAGITRDNFLLKMSDQEWEQVLNVNLTGAFYCTRAAAAMMAGKGGRIINLASVTALTGNIGQVNYAAAKAGLVGMTKTLARELAREGITVNAVAPGFIDTPMTAAVPDEVKKKLISGIPLGRTGTPEEVAALVRFLAGDEASYITGQVISCNGGMYI